MASRKEVSGPRGTAKDRALRLLAVRWRSREELRRRLTRAGFEPEDVDRALDDLEAAGLVDDERFAQEVVRHEAGSRRSGSRAILTRLRRDGVDPATAEQAVAGAGDEEDRACDLAMARMSRLASLPPEVASRRVFGLLLRRGYGAATAREATSAALSAVFAGLEPGSEGL